VKKIIVDPAYTLFKNIVYFLFQFTGNQLYTEFATILYATKTPLEENKA